MVEASSHSNENSGNEDGGSESVESSSSYDTES